MEIGQKHSLDLILKTAVQSSLRAILYFESLDHRNAIMKSKVGETRESMKMM